MAIDRSRASQSAPHACRASVPVAANPTAAGAMAGVRSGYDLGPALSTRNHPGPRPGPTRRLTAGGTATFQLHRAKCGSHGLRSRNAAVA